MSFCAEFHLEDEKELATQEHGGDQLKQLLWVCLLRNGQIRTTPSVSQTNCVILNCGVAKTHNFHVAIFFLFVYFRQFCVWVTYRGKKKRRTNQVTVHILCCWFGFCRVRKPPSCKRNALMKGGERNKVSLGFSWVCHLLFFSFLFHLVSSSFQAFQTLQILLLLRSFRPRFCARLLFLSLSFSVTHFVGLYLIRDVKSAKWNIENEIESEVRRWYAMLYFVM